MSKAFVSLPSTIEVLLLFSAGDSFTISLFCSISPSIPLSCKYKTLSVILSYYRKSTNTKHFHSLVTFKIDFLTVFALALAQ